MKWELLIDIYDVNAKTGKLLATCPVCGKCTFTVLNGVGVCTSCKFRGTQETIYRLKTGASRASAEEEVKAIKPKMRSGRLL